MNQNNKESNLSGVDRLDSLAGVTRREFLGMTAATLLVGGDLSDDTKSVKKNGIPYRPLGHTCESVSLVGLRGYHFGKQSDPEEGVRIIRTGLDEGINFLDNCSDYNGGESEIRMGKALRDGYRQKAFLMSKIDGRTKAAASSQTNESLRRLQTDHLDLLQFHEVIRDSDPGRIFAAGGALEAALEAKQAGKLRFVGFTGHKSPEIHLQMLATASQHGFLFDAVQMPLNVMYAPFDSFEKKVLPVLVRNNIGVLGMKPMGDHFVLDSKTATAMECLHYSMNLPTSVVITVAIRCRFFSRLSLRPAPFSPCNPLRFRRFSQKRRKLRKPASSSSTKRATVLTARTPTRSGLVSGLTISKRETRKEQHAGIHQYPRN